MIQFIIPLAMLAAKRFGDKLVEDKEDVAIAEGILEGTRQAEAELKAQVNRHLWRAVIRLSVNSALVIIAVLALPLFLARESVLLSIAWVYLFSMLHGVFHFGQSLRAAWRIYKAHRLNIKKYIEHAVFERVYEVAYRQAHSQTDNIWHHIFGQKSAADIAERIAQQSAVNATALLLDYVLKRIVFIVFVIVVYYLLSRVVVIPYLVLRETQLSFWQTLLYPFAFTIDYFWHLFSVSA